jgi:hypothetical protein
MPEANGRNCCCFGPRHSILVAFSGFLADYASKGTGLTDHVWSFRALLVNIGAGKQNGATDGLSSVSIPVEIGRSVPERDDRKSVLEVLFFMGAIVLLGSISCIGISWCLWSLFWSLDPITPGGP